MTRNQLQYQAQKEQMRHNKRQESIDNRRNEISAFSASETQRANLIKERETERSNRAQEALTSRGQNLKFASDMYASTTSALSKLTNIRPTQVK